MNTTAAHTRATTSAMSARPLTRVASSLSVMRSLGQAEVDDHGDHGRAHHRERRDPLLLLHAHVDPARDRAVVGLRLGIADDLLWHESGRCLDRLEAGAAGLRLGRRRWRG